MKYPEDFEQAWEAYKLASGYGVEKKASFREWKKAKVTAGLWDTIMVAIKKQGDYQKTMRQKGEFVSPLPHFKRWLRGERWEDMVDIKMPQIAPECPVLCDWPGCEYPATYHERGGVERCGGHLPSLVGCL